MVERKIRERIYHSSYKNFIKDNDIDKNNNIGYFSRLRLDILNYWAYHIMVIVYPSLLKKIKVDKFEKFDCNLNHKKSNVVLFKN